MTQHKRHRIVVEWFAMKIGYATCILLGALSFVTFNGWMYSHEQNESLQLFYFIMGPLLMCFFFYIAIVDIEREEQKEKIRNKKNEERKRR